MDWFITFVLAGIVIFFFISRKKTGSTAQEKPSATKPAVKQKDDFAGSSVGSFFLLEELVDHPNNEIQKDGEKIFEDEVQFSDTDIEDEFWDDENF